MARPGTVVNLQDNPTNVSVPTDTGTAFVLGTSDTGPLAATLIQSLDDFVTIFGQRQSYSVLYDALDLFFREGGNRAYISRVVGPGATSGFKNLLDAGAAVSLIATAVGPGAWSANYKVAVVAGVGGGTFKIQVTDSANNVLEDSGDLLTQQAAIQWSQVSKYIRLTLGASANNPALLAATVLSTGSDDRLNITDTQWLNAMNLFTADLGPGQILAPGRTSTAGQQQLITHAEANNRVALIDLVDSPTEATLETAAAALTDSRFGAVFTPWVNIPGIASTGNTSGATPRTVPPSAMVAGIIARNDPSLGTNRPSAGIAGLSRFVVGLSQPAFTDTQRQNMNGNSVNVIRSVYGSIRVYGWRSLANAVTDKTWLDFSNGRFYMDLSAELTAVGENYLFDEIDGQGGTTIGNFHSDLAGVLLSHFHSGELFGDNPDDAFSVNTGPGVNTLATIANLELHAVCAVRMSPMAEWVQIKIVKVDVSQQVVS